MGQQKHSIFKRTNKKTLKKNSIVLFGLREISKLSQIKKEKDSTINNRMIQELPIQI